MKTVVDPQMFAMMVLHQTQMGEMETGIQAAHIMLKVMTARLVVLCGHPVNMKDIVTANKIMKMRTERGFILYAQSRICTVAVQVMSTVKNEMQFIHREQIVRLTCNVAAKLKMKLKTERFFVPCALVGSMTHTIVA